MLKLVNVFVVLIAASNASPWTNKFLGMLEAPFGGRIVGGDEVEPNSLPYQISFQDLNGYHFCGGSILDKETVLTAAHCCVKFRANQIQIVAGEHDLLSASGDEQRAYVDEVVMHKKFNAATYSHDICLLKLNSSFKLNDKVQPISLPEKDQEFTDDVVTSGWGRLYFGGPTSPVLLSTTVQMVPIEECNDLYNGETDETMICAAAPGKDACQGDSGGPLAINNVLVGIVSWGEGCAYPNYPGIYSKVSNFIDWISKHR